MAAPVESTSPSVMVGAAWLLRDKAPSTMVRSTPYSAILSSTLRTPPVVAGPDKITLPDCNTRAVTSRPKEVLSSERSTISETSCRCR